MSGVVGFIVGNIVIIGVVVLGVLGYRAYTQQGGKGKGKIM